MVACMRHQIPVIQFPFKVDSVVKRPVLSRGTKGGFLLTNLGLYFIQFLSHCGGLTSIYVGSYRLIKLQRFERMTFDPYCRI